MIPDGTDQWFFVVSGASYKIYYGDMVVKGVVQANLDADVHGATLTLKVDRPYLRVLDQQGWNELQFARLKDNA